ncbi:DUF983 domain-containing protein [Aquimarina sp. W85]|uniref:DUF983 domain-containing protein n=1 Tax=Aquimarina rhodophyticola TaxID=3342246 RepID=UPI00366FAC9E
MFGKGSKLYSILFLKCPRCHQGDFLKSHPYKFSDFNKVKEECDHCKLKYSIEPSFYYGSMYVSYGVGIAIAVTVFVILYLLDSDLQPLTIFYSILITLVVFMPYIGAISKAIWANLFFKYDKELAAKIKQPKS